MPETLAVPTVVPPEEQLVGAVPCGPNTLKVTVPLADDPPDRVADKLDGAIGTSTVSDVGAVSDNDGDACVTVVAGIAAPQTEDDGLLLSSPL